MHSMRLKKLFNILCEFDDGLITKLHFNEPRTLHRSIQNSNLTEFLSVPCSIDTSTKEVLHRIISEEASETRICQECHLS